MMRRQFDRAARGQSPATSRGRAAAKGQPREAILRLQRSAGNRAVGRVLGAAPFPPAHAARQLQRNGKGKVNIIDPAKASAWYQKSNEYDEWMRDYAFIQECMMNLKLYRPALEALARAVLKERRWDTEARDDEAPLDRVLLAMERKHEINLAGAPIYTRTLSGEVFGEMSQQSVIATDPGAGARHGAYTHRIQWWVVLTHADKLKHRPADLVRRAIDPQFKPPEANWPQQSEVEGLGTVPLAENRGALWDALFDRTVPQMYKALYNLGELGISHPELFTAEIIQGKFPELGDVAEIIRAQVGRNWGGGGGASDALITERALTNATHTQYREGVYFRVAVA